MVVTTSKEIIDWLLDADPSIRWQVMRDLLRESDDVLARERARVATEGWGARLLALQGASGDWGPGPYIYPGWIATTDTLLMLRDFGLDPSCEQARAAIASVCASSNWGPEFKNNPYFEGEEEACINGRVLINGAYFETGSRQLVDLLLSEQLDDGGWNCYAPPSKRTSFHSTICVLEGLMEYERAHGTDSAITTARECGHEYLLERRMFKSLSTGEIVNPDWLQFSFPMRWHYDVLWGLDYFRSAGVKRDPRMNEAITLVEQKRDAEGRWPLENPHQGIVHFELEGAEGTPSRWNTLRALRVLDWFGD